MFIGTLYNKTIKANNMTTLERLASRIANNYFNSIDEMIVDYEDLEGNIFEQGRMKYIRRNQKYPNGTIIRGKWK